MEEKLIRNCIGFQWDVSNETKNWKKHAVSKWECEQVFFNKPFLLYEDKKHSKNETRYYALGQTNLQRLLFVVFTIRNKHIRIISARDMNRKERSAYEKT